MKLLVTGREGQVARALAERGAESGHEIVFAARPELDLEDAASIERVVGSVRPDLIINAAAYTAVDQAEDEPERAGQVNGRAPGILAAAARHCSARIIQLSTDYVFDGSGDAPHRENATVRPLGVYGRSKAEGEVAVRAENPDHLIVRTAWVYSPFGRNFVKTMLGLARERPMLRVVEDQVGNPTSALDIADGLLAAVKCWEEQPGRGLGETVHLAGAGTTSWAGFARAIFAESRARGGSFAEVEGIATADWPTRATRPLNSRLSSDKFGDLFGYSCPEWRSSLAPVIARLLAEQA